MFPRYLAVSVGALAIDYLVYLGLVRLAAGVTLPLAAAIGYLVGAVFHYWASRRFVFARGWLHDRRAVEFALFLTTGLGGAAITSAVVWAISRLFDAGVHLPKICAVIVSFLFVYFARKLIVFRSQP